MRAKLFCPLGTFAGETFEIDKEVIIGRKATRRSSEYVALPDKRISTEHARIRLDPEELCYYVEDLGSTNGTSLAGVRINGRERLHKLDVLNFGDVCDFIFQVLGQDDDPHAEERTMVQSEPVPFPSPEPDPLKEDSDALKTTRDTAPPPLPPSLSPEDKPDDE